jgi:hypothetical protein
MGMKPIVAAVLLLAACRSAGTDPGDDKLSGSFQWIGSTGGIAGRSMTPASEGYTVRFNFTGNQVTVFRNDSAKATSTVTIRGDEVTYQPSISVFLFDQGIDVQTFQEMAGDTIALRDPCCDRFDHRFIRR